MKKDELGLLLLRIGLGGVFLVFGIDKFFNPKFWSAYMPPWFSGILPMEMFTFIYLLGVFEIIFGLAVLVGFCTRFSAGVCAVFLLGIIFSLGFNEIIVRDAGLFFLALGVVVLGAGVYSLDAKFFKRS